MSRLPRVRATGFCWTLQRYLSSGKGAPWPSSELPAAALSSASASPGRFRWAPKRKGLLTPREVSRAFLPQKDDEPEPEPVQVQAQAPRRQPKLEDPLRGVPLSDIVYTVRAGGGCAYQDRIAYC